MVIKYIFTDLGDLDGQADKLINVRSDEKQLEFSTTKEDADGDLLFKTPSRVLELTALSILMF